MRANRPCVWLAAGLVAAALVGGCAGGTATTPGATNPPEPFVVAMTPPASAVAATPARTDAVVQPSAPATTPLPTMDPALIGTWTGELGMVRSIPGNWARASYTVVGPCALIDERCGTWEWRGMITEEIDWAPWASIGEEVSCEGQLRYRGTREEAYLFLATTESYEGAGGPGCGVQITGLTAEADDALHLDVFGGGAAGSKTKGGYATLHRVGGSAAPSGG